MNERLKTFIRLADKFMVLLAMAFMAGLQISIALAVTFMAVKLTGVYSDVSTVLVLCFALITQSVMKAQFKREFNVLEAQFPLFLVWVGAQMVGGQSSLVMVSKIIPMSIGMSFAVYLSMSILRAFLTVFDFKETPDVMPKAKNEALQLADMTADEYDAVIGEILEERKAYRTR